MSLITCVTKIKRGLKKKLVSSHFQARMILILPALFMSTSGTLTCISKRAPLQILNWIHVFFLDTCQYYVIMQLLQVITHMYVTWHY